MTSFSFNQYEAWKRNQKVQDKATRLPSEPFKKSGLLNMNLYIQSTAFMMDTSYLPLLRHTPLMCVCLCDF